jgi:DnaK suppressor protein
VSRNDLLNTIGGGGAGMSETPLSLNMTLVEEFSGRLREARQALLRTLAVTDEEMITLQGHEAGAVVEGAATDAAAILSRLEGREKHELDEIEDAVVRLEAGSFGLCERCGQAIALARLRAIPAARYCLDCQRKTEMAR